MASHHRVRRMKKADNTNVFKKFSDKLEKFEQNLITHPSAVPFSNVFQSPSTSSLTQLPHSHSETVLYNQQYSDTHTNDDLVSLQNYSYDNNNQNNDPTILVRPQSDSSFQSATTTGTFYPEEIPEKPWKPIASDHHTDDYVKMLKRFGQLDELALAQFRLAGQTTDLPAKFRFLDEAIDKLTSNYWWQTQVFDYRRLLEKQQTLHIVCNFNLDYETFERSDI
ncbi:unnamed protein product [Didymodactylos carnosus]|uniref:Uncharacterized protein n=1 Tax=Didymodactylos carnosus TaxID=1234261 RepID=A0A8S2CT45_9BILA|nr:unnamed protein product [Didymodactylos carnosus]CAF3507943.1 unnamed protein product [Didymodactylos carnosus]